MDLLMMGLNTILTADALFWVTMGVVLGVVLGAMPGISNTMAVILCISFTYSMKPVVAIAFLAAVYSASITGGSVPAILFKIPGTPASAATALDGYPMAQRGEAGRALSIALYGSAIGGTFSVLIMYLLTQPLMAVALKFSSIEMFSVCFLGLSIVIFLDQDNMLNTFASTVIGLWLATVGLDTFTTVPRFTFGYPTLLNGVESLSVMLGLFALVEVFSEITKKSTDFGAIDTKKTADISKLVSLKEMWHLKWTMFRSSVLGTVIGIMPGPGATIASWMSYSVEKKMSKHPEEMGNGDPHGIVASETGNSAVTGGGMVPLLAMGIPGSNASAVMIAALALHGVQMGPLLLRAQPVYLSATFIAMLMTNIMMIVVCMFIAKIFAKILNTPYWALGAIIMVLAITGSYARINSINDVWILAVAGILGYYFKKFKFSASAMILGLVLGPLLERHFRRSLQLANNDIMFVLNRPLALIIFGIIILMYAYGFYGMYKNSKKKAA
jgi:putative tricarboxylic transport membrane protein